MLQPILRGILAATVAATLAVLLAGGLGTIWPARGVLFFAAPNVERAYFWLDVDHGILTRQPRFDPLTETAVYAPDTRRVLIYRADRDRRWLWVEPARGPRPENPTPLLSIEAPGVVGVPRWSPDGRYLLTSLRRADELSSNLVMIDAQTGDLRQITNSPYIEHQPNWSPDGRQIVYRAHDGIGVDLYVLSLDDGTSRRLTSEGVEREPAWSPDGRTVAFASLAALDAPQRYPPPAADLPDLLALSAAPEWSHDSRWLVYVRDGDMFLLDAVTGDEIPLLDINEPLTVPRWWR